MATKNAKKCSKNCNCEAVLLDRLEAKFAIGYRAPETLDPMDIAGWLDIAEEEAQEMIDIGVLKLSGKNTLRDGVELETLLAFFEEHGKRWWQRRFEQRLDALRGGVHRQKAEARRFAREVTKNVHDKADAESTKAAA